MIKPFAGRYELGKLPGQPDLSLLRLLPTLEDEVGMQGRLNQWVVIKGCVMGVPGWFRVEEADIFLHSHVSDGNQEQDGGSTPSIRDFLNCSLRAKEFIVSQKGITQYWSLESENARYLEQIFWEEFLSPEPKFGRDKIQEYLQLLRDIDAKFTVYPWEELDEERLKQLFFS